MASDVGIKISQSGRDVVGAGDSELLFSSSWPSLRFSFNGHLNETGFGTGIHRLFDHNLGFVPAFLPYVTDSLGNFYIFREQVWSDNKSIYWSFPAGPPPPFTMDIGLYVFPIDIEKNFEAPQIDTGSSAKSGANAGTGIKFSKSGKDVSSHDLRDFIIHSRTRTPLIHAVANGTIPGTGNAGFVYEHNLPYDPMFLAYIRFNQSGGRTLYSLLNNLAGLQVSDKTIILGEKYTTQTKASIVVLKDPFEIEDNIITVKI